MEVLSASYKSCAWEMICISKMIAEPCMRFNIGQFQKNIFQYEFYDIYDDVTALIDIKANVLQKWLSISLNVKRTKQCQNCTNIRQFQYRFIAAPVTVFWERFIFECELLYITGEIDCDRLEN